MANLGVEVPPAPQPRPAVTVVTKKGRRAIENAEDIAAALRRRFPTADVGLLDGNSLSAISVKARVRACVMQTAVRNTAYQRIIDLYPVLSAADALPGFHAL
jgi:hypothetical protein